MLNIFLIYSQKIKENPFILQNIKTMILRLIGIVLLFAFTLYLTHNYDSKIIGQYDFARTYLLVVGSLCLLGTEQSILYFAGYLKSQNNFSALKKVYLKKISIIFSISVFVLLLFLFIDDSFLNNYFNDNNVYKLLLKATAILFFYAITLLNTEVFRALDRMYIAELYRNAFKYIFVIIGSVVLFQINQKEYLADVFLYGFVVLAIISTIMVLNSFKNQKHDSTEKITHLEIVKKSYPMSISAMAIFLLMTFDVIFLKKYWGSQTVAYYNVAIKIMTIVAMIINVVNVNLSSKVAEYFYSNNSDELRRTLKNSARLIFALTFPLSVLICFNSSFILSFFGQEYVVASQALIILILGQGLCAFFGLAPIYLNMTGRQKIFQRILLSAVLVNFLLNRILIPDYGLIGASIAFSVSMFFWNIIAAVFAYKKDKAIIFLT